MKRRAMRGGSILQGELCLGREEIQTSVREMLCILLPSLLPSLVLTIPNYRDGRRRGLAAEGRSRNTLVILRMVT